MIVTFYSYKGGVGRTLALANVACLMAEDADHPQRVLVWDFDLDAPGLYWLFPPKRPQPYGFLQMAYEYASTGIVPEIRDYIYESSVPNIDVLSAGSVTDEYCQKLQEIDWLSFFAGSSCDSHRGCFFGELLNQLMNSETPYDYILVDSRTGLNDQAGICTQVLPDILVTLFRLDQQNLDGLEHVIPSIRRQLKARGRSDTAIIPVASQVGTAASRRTQEHVARATDIFGEEPGYIRFDEDLLGKGSLFCLREEQEQMWPRPWIVEDYVRLCNTIRELNPSDTKTQTKMLRRQMAIGDFPTATRTVLSLISRRPRLERAWEALMRLLAAPLSTADRQNFESVVTNTLRHDAGNPHAHKLRAFLSINRAPGVDSNHLQEATEALEMALQNAQPESRKSERATLHRTLAFLASCRGRLENAVDKLRMARDLTPSNVQILLDLARFHMRMGPQYFAMAKEELESVPDNIGREKVIPLSYITAFMDKDASRGANVASDAIGEQAPLVRAHVLLASGKREEAIHLFQAAYLPASGAGNAENAIEFFICAEEFDKALAIEKEQAEGRDSGQGIAKLARYLKGGDDNAPDEQDVIRQWQHLGGWRFQELLLFRARCMEGNNPYGARLDIIEKLCEEQDFQLLRTTLLTDRLSGLR